MGDAEWDGRFLELAKHVAQWSKDPSTKVGAVITNGRRIVSVGFNGFPCGVKDDHERYLDRELKYKLIVHAERNAIIFAQQYLFDCTIYTWPFMPCSACAGMIVQSEISRVVAPRATPEQEERWGKEFETARLIFVEAGVRLDLV